MALPDLSSGSKSPRVLGRVPGSEMTHWNSHRYVFNNKTNSLNQWNSSMHRHLDTRQREMRVFLFRYSACQYICKLFENVEIEVAYKKHWPWKVLLYKRKNKNVLLYYKQNQNPIKNVFNNDSTMLNNKKNVLIKWMNNDN